MSDRIHRTQRSLRMAALFAGVGLAIGVAPAALASEFTGQIKAVNASAMTVERQGDAVKFVKTPGTVVSGAKSDWKALAKGDRVSVSWKIADKPPKAHRVRVQARKK